VSWLVPGKATDLLEVQSNASGEINVKDAAQGLQSKGWNREEEGFGRLGTGEEMLSVG